MHDSDLIQLQAFEPKQRKIEGRIIVENDHLRKGKRVTSNNQLGHEDETTSRKCKQATSDNQLRHEDKENGVKRRSSPKTLHKDLDGFED